MISNSLNLNRDADKKTQNSSYLYPSQTVEQRYFFHSSYNTRNLVTLNSEILTLDTVLYKNI